MRVRPASRQLPAASSVGIEIDDAFAALFGKQSPPFSENANKTILNRLAKHKDFVASRITSEKPMNYFNEHIGLPVFTRQETHLTLFRLKEISGINHSELTASYEPMMPEESHSALT